MLPMLMNKRQHGINKRRPYNVCFNVGGLTTSLQRVNEEYDEVNLNVIISFAGLEDRQEIIKSKRPFALQPLAGSTILGHILERLQDVQVQSYIIGLNAGAEHIEEWAKQFLSEGLLRVVTVENASTPVMALRSFAGFIDDGPMLFVSGSFITEADYTALVCSRADVACLVQDDQGIIPAENWSVDDAGFYTSSRVGHEVYWAGSCWFRSGSDFLAAVTNLDTAGVSGVTALLSLLYEQGSKIATYKADTCLATDSPARLLHANLRLMQLGYCSEDAIERSYAEEFTVLPPVFLHETAVIDNAVIGPFVNLEADAVVRNSVVSNSLIGAGAQVTNMVLDSSLIGDRAQVSGRKQAVMVGDDSQLKVG